jgi:hypothetical protein
MTRLGGTGRHSAKAGKEVNGVGGRPGFPVWKIYIMEKRGYVRGGAGWCGVVLVAASPVFSRSPSYLTVSRPLIILPVGYPSMSDVTKEILLIILMPTALLLTTLISGLSLLKWVQVFLEIKRRYAGRVHRFNHLEFLLYNPIAMLVISNLFVWATYQHNSVTLIVTVVSLGVVNLAAFVKFWRQPLADVVARYVVVHDSRGWHQVEGNNCDVLDDDLVNCLVNGGNIQKHPNRSNDLGNDLICAEYDVNFDDEYEHSEVRARKIAAGQKIKLMYDEFLELRNRNSDGTNRPG